uniref:C6 domain-containing protein n=1 Tax=Caenorhabditis japonica TaxID=281687 RepID=A0A8R1IR82_CAEJA
MKKYFSFLFFCVKITFACLPTQNVDGEFIHESSTSNIVVTSTTTTTETPYRGGFLCATAAQVGLTYTLGILQGYNFGDANTCSTIFTCPLGTTSKVKIPIVNLISPGPPLVIATCQQTGSNAGIWYYGIPPLTTPVEIVGTTCEGII